eukprot:scaffold31106_cov33-Cyclotella_meneghiniana.AAC.1
MNTNPPVLHRQVMGGMHGDTRYLTQMANKNKPAAMCQLGHMYLHGENLMKDESVGLKWLERVLVFSLYGVSASGFSLDLCTFVE